MPNEHPEIMYNYYYSIYSKQESTNYTDFETVRGQVVNYTSLNLFLSIHFLAKKVPMDRMVQNNGSTSNSSVSIKFKILVS